MLNTVDSGLLASAHVLSRVEAPHSRDTYLWHRPEVSEGTQRTLCFLHLSHAKAFPILPSLASMVKMEFAGLGDLGESRSVSAGWCIVGKSEQMPRASLRCELRPRSSNDGRRKGQKCRGQDGSPSGGCGRRGFRACRMQKRTNKLHMLLLPRTGG
jgi:hypothetical protein